MSGGGEGRLVLAGVGGGWGRLRRSVWRAGTVWIAVCTGIEMVWDWGWACGLCSGWEEGVMGEAGLGGGEWGRGRRKKVGS